MSEEDSEMDVSVPKLLAVALSTVGQPPASGSRLKGSSRTSPPGAHASHLPVQGVQLRVNGSFTPKSGFLKTQ